MFGKFSRRKNSESEPVSAEAVDGPNGLAEDVQPEASGRGEPTSSNGHPAGAPAPSDQRVASLNLASKSVDELFELLGRQVEAN